MPLHMVARREQHENLMGKILLTKNYNNKHVNELLTQPPLTTITMKELISAMESLKFTVEIAKGSHYKFRFPPCPDLLPLIVPKPHGGKNTVKRVYIKIIQNQIIEILERKKNLL